VLLILSVTPNPGLTYVNPLDRFTRGLTGHLFIHVQSTVLYIATLYEFMVTTDSETSTADTYMLYKTYFQILSAMDVKGINVGAHVLK
jgi:hypothetical protein